MPTEAELETMKGMLLAEGAVQLLTAPKWDGSRYVALAIVGSALCNIEVSIKLSGT